MIRGFKFIEKEYDVGQWEDLMALVEQVGANRIGNLDIDVVYELVFFAFTLDTQSMHDIKFSVLKMLKLLDAECP
jgi:hypothetical protein